jgi:tetratricopeptide (TPR) repeat protein
MRWLASLVASMTLAATGCVSTASVLTAAPPATVDSTGDLLDAVPTDQVPGAMAGRYVVQSGRAHGYHRGQLVGLFAEPQAGGRTILVGLGLVLEPDPGSLLLRTRVVDERYHSKPLRVGRLPKDPHLPGYLGSVIGPSGPSSVQLNLPGGHLVRPGSVFRVLPSTPNQARAQVRHLDDEGLGLVEVTDVSNTGARARIVKGAAPPGAWAERVPGAAPTPPQVLPDGAGVTKVLLVIRRGQRSMQVAKSFQEGLASEGFKDERSGILIREEEHHREPVSPAQMQTLGKQRRVDIVFWLDGPCAPDNPTCLLPLITYVEPDQWEMPASSNDAEALNLGSDVPTLNERLRVAAAALAALLHHRHHQWALAAYHYSRVPLDPHDGTPLGPLFLCHLYLEEWDRAEAVARAMIDLGTRLKKEPLERHGRLNLGAVAKSQRRFDEASREYATARQMAEAARDDRGIALAWSGTADVLYARGQIDEALEISRTKQLPILERLGDVPSIASTWAAIADMLYDRGQLDETIEVLSTKAIPLYERLGDLRSIALGWGRIADVLTARSRYDQSLEIRRHKELPAYERLGDLRSAAITWGQICEVLYLRGKFDDCLKILRTKELPFYESTGDTRAIAFAWGRVADVIAAQGKFDEALTIRQTKQLPAAERLGDRALIANSEWKIGRLLRKKGANAEAIPHYRRARDQAREVKATWLKDLETELEAAGIRLDAP